MKRHSATVIVVTLLTLMSSLINLSPARGAASASTDPLGSPHIVNKVTMGDTSVDGPALWTNNPAAGAVAGSPAAVLGWTGTDAARHLNVMTSADGLNYGNKRVLAETSATRPAVAVTASGAVAVAWTGMDPGRRLNVLVNAYSASPQKLTLWTESGFMSPALAYRSGVLWLSWTGIDSGHTLNVIPITINGGLHAGQKLILGAFHSVAGPSLTLDPHGNRLLLAWSLTSPATRIQFAVSDTGASWVAPLSVPIGELTGSTPSLLGVGAGGIPGYFFGWTGTNSSHSLNVRYTETFPQWPAGNNKSVLRDTALEAPALGHIGSSGNVLLAWTGTNPQHHLNVATISVALAAACIAPAGVQPVSPVVISTGSTALPRRVSLTFDSDGGSPGNATAYLNSLQSHHQIHASFFLTGQFAQANPAIARRIVTDGHDIGNHTQDHPDLTSPPLTDAAVCTEFNQAEQAIVSASGHTSRPYFRPPFGAYNDQVRYLAAGLGYRTIMWSIDPRDWDSATTTQDIINRVLNSPNLKPGAIILMHFNSPNERYALDSVIVGLEQRGYSIVPLSQLLQ